jgi:acetyl-CoA carboxylase carboxyl transferase subunit beta
VDGDWRGVLLAGAERLDVAAAARDPACWPGYTPRTAVTVWRLATGPVCAAWDFSGLRRQLRRGRRDGAGDGRATAVHERRPLLTLVRSGGTRLQEGMAALVGIPRARMALLALARAGLPHLSVADAPTTGGVWISVASAADVRVAVDGATVGFAGPRVVEAVTGALPAPGSHTGASAAAAGLVDAVLPAAQVPAWVARVLTALTSVPEPMPPPAGVEPARVAGSEQVRRSRARVEGGRDLLARLLTDVVPLQAPHADRTVAACLGRSAGRPVVGVAVAAEVHGRPTPDGYRLATRAVRLAGRLGLPLLALVDTPGAEPGTESEDGGIAPAMGEALDAMLTCPSPTLALVHGEGGSGGALALAAADVVLVTSDSYFAAIGPEGAAAALRRTPDECADLMRVTPRDLLDLGAADAVVDDPAAAASWLAALAERPRPSGWPHARPAGPRPCPAPVTPSSCENGHRGGRSSLGSCPPTCPALEATCSTRVTGSPRPGAGPAPRWRAAPARCAAPRACGARARSWRGWPRTPSCTRWACCRRRAAATPGRPPSASRWTTCRRSSAACCSATSSRPARRSCWCTGWSTTARSSRSCAAPAPPRLRPRPHAELLAVHPGRAHGGGRLERLVERTCAETGYERVHVVGHSLGGLVARYYVQRMGGDSRVHTLVTLGSPHSGTNAAYLLPQRLVRQLRPGSELMQELAAPAAGCRTRFVAYWSDLDQLIVPKRSATLVHADLQVRNVLLRGVGHMSLPICGRVVHEIGTLLAHLDEDGSTRHAGVTSIAAKPAVVDEREPAPARRRGSATSSA